MLSRVYKSKRLLLLLAIALVAPSCGYRIRSSVGRLPAGIKSIGIPTFQNFTNQYKIEQLITRAVLKEFSVRTNTTVNSSSSNVDAVLLGEIRSVGSVPVTFGTEIVGSQTFGSAFLVTVQASLRLKRISDSAIIWKNESFLYRERYVLNADLKDFFSEENPALERLARSFASGVASAILDRMNP